MPSSALISILFGLAAVAPGSEGSKGSEQPPESPSGPHVVEVDGTIRSVRGGIKDAPILMHVEHSTPATASNLTLHASRPEFEDELRRLAGARIRITGVRDDPRQPSQEHVYVERYEILDVGHHEVPRIGHLATLDLDGRPRLLFVDESGLAQLLPEGWAKKLKTQAGAKIWMLGSTIDGRLVPKKFAILKPPRSANTPAAPSRAHTAPNSGK